VSLPLKLVVAALLIKPDDSFLLAQRPPGKAWAGYWEFPGGKVEPGESPEQALCRELNEELGVTVSASSLRPLTFASHAYDTFHLLMPLYACREWEGDICSGEGQALTWTTLAMLQRKETACPLLPADIPLLDTIRRCL
jgi:8-oxo-dGTP diphosphatase